MKPTPPIVFWRDHPHVIFTFVMSNGWTFRGQVLDGVCDGAGHPITLMVMEEDSKNPIELIFASIVSVHEARS